MNQRSTEWAQHRRKGEVGPVKDWKNEQFLCVIDSEWDKITKGEHKDRIHTCTPIADSCQCMAKTATMV